MLLSLTKSSVGRLNRPSCWNNPLKLFGLILATIVGPTRGRGSTKACESKFASWPYRPVIPTLSQSDVLGKDLPRCAGWRPRCKDPEECVDRDATLSLIPGALTSLPPRIAARWGRGVAIIACFGDLQCVITKTEAWVGAGAIIHRNLVLGRGVLDIVRNW